ncbi:uncharacterized protein METZ01_LOCUS292976, partial [marine metagenome]
KLAKALDNLPATVTVSDGVSQVGGGALPQAQLPSVTLDLIPEKIGLKEFAAKLRRAPMPVMGAISGQRFRLDLRTILPEQEKLLIKSIQQALH